MARVLTGLLLRRWMTPGGLEVTRAEVDERPGGRFRIW
jgi:uncharacterized protein YndB with AHSA1/START domain